MVTRENVWDNTEMRTIWRSTGWDDRVGSAIGNFTPIMTRQIDLFCVPVQMSTGSCWPTHNWADISPAQDALPEGS